MALKGIKSLHDQINYISNEIGEFLTKEKFSIARKSHSPAYANIVGEVMYYKELGGDDHLKLLVFVSGSEIVVEAHYLDNGTGAEVLRETFGTDEEFIEAYNNFIEWVQKTLK